VRTSHQPWFRFPLARFIEMIDLAAVRVRALQDSQLAAEIEDLVTRYAEPGAHPAERLMRQITRPRLPAGGHDLPSNTNEKENPHELCCSD
jgi:hypothetical protein